ncbi:MAG: hypothetical protein WCO84_03420 [bacterium]
MKNDKKVVKDVALASLFAKIMVTVFVIIFVSIFFNRESSVEDIVREKSSRKLGQVVSNKFVPVMIYRLDGRGGGKFIGCGSYFLKHGRGQVITSEHLFVNNKTPSAYAFRVARPWENDIRHFFSGLNKFSEFVRGKECFPDVVVLDCGKIATISYHSDRMDSIVASSTTLSSCKQRLRSLVSGEVVDVIAAVEMNDDDPSSFVIDCSSVKGESGTGFVDSENNIYIVKGTIKSWPGYSKYYKGDVSRLTVVSGPYCVTE